MIIMYALVVALGFPHLPVIECSIISDESVVLQLAYLTEKYEQLDKKIELITEENAILKTRVEELAKENLYIKTHLKFMEESIVNTNDDKNDQKWNETTRYTTMHYHNDANSLQETEDLYAARPDIYIVNNLKRSKEVQSIKGVANTRTMHRRLLIPPGTTHSPSITKVAFTAILTKTLSLGQIQIIQYDKVITNVGNAYDPRHGHFTAPTKAVYLMACTVMNKQGGTVGIEMVKNGITIARLYGDSSNYNMGTQVSIVFLEKGDMVWVRHGEEMGGSSQTLHFAEYNTFSGTILFLM